MNKQQWEEELKLQDDLDEQYDDYSPVEIDYAPNS